jgi:hypothetical protein
VLIQTALENRSRIRLNREHAPAGEGVLNHRSCSLFRLRLVTLIYAALFEW